MASNFIISPDGRITKGGSTSSGTKQSTNYSISDDGRISRGSSQATQQPKAQPKTYTYKDRKGNQYTFDDDAVTWISKRYRNNAQNYYDSDNEDQANLANGLLPRSFQQSYKTKGDRQLYEMGMPSEKYLEGYLGEYQAWRDGGNGGAYYDVDSPNAKGMVDFIKSKWKSDWNYGKSTDDLLRQSKGEMPAAQAKLYMNSKTGMTNSWADEYYQSRGLPPASEMDYYVNAYNEYLTNTALKEDFYVDVGNRVLNYSVNDGIKNDDNVYDWKDADGKTVRKTGKQIWQDTYTSALAEEKYAPLLSVMPKPEKVTNSKDVEYVSIDDAVTAGALAVTAARPTEKDPWSYAPSYDEFVEQTNANDAALRADALLSRLTLSDAEQSALTMAGKNPDDMTVGDYLDYRQSEADKSYVEGMDFTPDAFDLFDQDYGSMPVTDRITFLAENGASKSEIKDYVKYERSNYDDEDIDFDSAEDAAISVAKDKGNGGWFSRLFGGGKKEEEPADEADSRYDAGVSFDNPAPVPEGSAYTVEAPTESAADTTDADTDSYSDTNARNNFYSGLKARGLSDKIDLDNRPETPTSMLRTAGYDVPEDDDRTATVFSMATSNEDGTKTILFTPILQDGTILQPEEAESYANDILYGAPDELGITLGIYEGPDSAEQSTMDGQALSAYQQEQMDAAHVIKDEHDKLTEKGIQSGTKAVQDKLSSVFNNALNSMYSDADKTPEGLEWLTASGFSMLNGGDPIEYGGDTTIYEKGVRQIVDNSLVYKDGVVPKNIMKSENVGRTVTKRKLTMTEDEAVEAGSNPDADVTGERTLSNGIKIKSLSGGKGFGSELDSDYAEQNTLGISSPEEEEPESFTSGGTWNYLDPEQKDKHYVNVKTDMVSYYDESGELNWVPYADLENGSVDNELSEDTIDGMLSAYEQTFGSDEGKTFKPSGTVTLADTYKTLDWFIKNRVNPEFVYDFFYKLAEDGVLLEDNDETYVDEHYDTLTAAWAEPSEQSVATLWDAARSKYQPYEKSVVQSVADSARKYYSDGSGYQDYLFHQALRKEGYGWTINKEDAARAYYCAVGILADAKASGNYTDEELSHINPEDAQNVWDSFSDEDRQSLYDSFSESYAYNRDLYHPDGERVARIVFDLIPRFGANTAAAGVGLIGTVASFIGRGEDVVNSDMYQNATKRQARYDTFTYGGVSSGKDKAVNIGGRVVDEVTRMYATGLAGQGVSAVTGAANKANVFAKAAEKVVVTGKAKNLVKKGVEFLGRLTAVSNVPMVARAIGAYFNQAVSEGADPNEMSTGVYATVTGVVEGVTESLSYYRWTNKAWGSDKLFKLIQNGSKSLTKGTAILFKFKVGAAAVCAEILQEYSSNFASWAMARATYDKDAALSDQCWAETTYMTALVTLLGKGIGGGTSVNQVVSNYMLDNGISTSLLDVMFADTQVAALREDVVADLTPNAALLSDEKFKSANNNIVNSARQINAENEAFNAKVAEYEGNIQSCLGELNAASEALTQADVNNPAEYTEAMERYTTAKAMYDEAVAYTESTDFMSLAKMHEEKIAQYKQASDKSTAALNGHFIAMHNMFSGYLSPFTIIDETKTSIEEHAALMAQTATLLSQQNLSVDELAQLDEFNDRMVALNTKIDQGSAIIANSSKYIAELEARIAQAKATGASVAKLAAEAKVESEKAAGQTTIGDALKAKGIEIAPTLDQEEALSLLQNGVVYAMGNDPALFNECEDAIAKLNAGQNVDSTLSKLVQLGVKADKNFDAETFVPNVAPQSETSKSNPAVPANRPSRTSNRNTSRRNATTATQPQETVSSSIHKVGSPIQMSFTYGEENEYGIYVGSTFYDLNKENYDEFKSSVEKNGGIVLVWGGADESESFRSDVDGNGYRQTIVVAWPKDVDGKGHGTYYATAVPDRGVGEWTNLFDDNRNTEDNGISITRPLIVETTDSSAESNGRPVWFKLSEKGEIGPYNPNAGLESRYTTENTSGVSPTTSIVAEDVPTVAEDVSGEESNPTTAEEAAEAFTAEEDVEAPAPAEQLGPQTVETTNEDSNYKDQSKAWKKLSPNESVVTINKAQMDRCSKMAEAIGAKIAWDETRANGRYENGVIHLNPNQIIDVHGKGLNAKSMPVEMLVFKHEMTHYLESLDQSEFNGLLDMMMDYDKSKYGEQQFEAKWNAFSARVKQSRAERYDGTPEQFENFWINNGDAIVRSEYSAIFAAENLFTDMKSIQYFVDHQQKTASKVSLLVQNLIHNKLGIGNDPRTYNVSASMQKQLTKIEQRYLQAFANAGKHNTDAVREYQMSTWDAAEALHKMQPKIERKLLSGIKLNNKASLSGYVGDIVELLSNGDTSVLSVDSPAMNRLIDFLTANMYGENKNKVPAQDKELVKSVVKDIRNTVFSLDLGNGTLIRNAKENYPYLKRNFSTQKAGTYTKSGKKVASIDGFFADNFTDYYTGDLSIEDLPWNGATKSHPILGELPRGEDNQLEWLNAFIEEYGTRKNDAFNFGSTIVSGLDALEMNRDTFAEYVVSDFTEAISSNPRLASTLLTGEYSEEGIEKARQSVESKYWSNPIQEFINEGTADSEYGGDYGDVMGDTLFDTNESFSNPNVTPDLDAEYMSLAEKYSNGTISEDEENRLGEMVGRQAKERNAKLFDAYERTIGPLDLERLKVDPNRSDSDMKLPDLVTYDDNGNIIPLSKRFDAENPDVRYYTDISFDNVTPIEETRYADPMYYKSERVITALNLSKFDAPSLVKMLQGKGVKPDELKWLGLEQWLSDKKSVSKGELLQFISDSRATVQPTTEMDVAGNNVVNRLVSPDGSVVGRLVTSHATDGDGNPALYIGTADGSSAIQHAIRLAAEGGYDSVVFKTDSIKPKDVANFVKPWGTMASYEEITVGDSAIDGIGVKITDDMRESVLYEGQPLFDRGLTFGGNDESWSTMSLDARKKATSQFFDNTVEYVTDESSVKAVNDVLAALGVPGATYEKETEKQSIIKAREALNKDFDGEWKRLKTTSAPWTSVEMDEAMGILAACRKVADETGNVQQYYDWLRTTQRHVTANAQALQALAKYTRSTVEGWIVHGLHITENAFRNATPRQQSNVRKTQGTVMDAVVKARSEGTSSSELSNMLKKNLGKVYADKVAKAYDDFTAGRITEAQLNEAIEGVAKQREGIANLTLADITSMMDHQKESAEHQKLYDSLKKQYDESTDDAERKELLKRMDEEDYLMRASNNRAAQVIANLEPGTFKEWASSWRRIAMLLNPKTMIKNAVANAVFAPLEWAKDVVATPFDILMSNLYGTQRTTTAGSIVEEYKGRIAGAKAAISDIKLGVDTKEGDGEKYEGGQKRVWTAGGKDNAFRRTMQNLDNLVSYGMRAGDRPYFEGALNNRLSQLKALGYDMDSAETRNDAIAYALDRTFQNNSKLANALSTLRTTLNLGMPVGIGDMILPFVQTPANIADKLLDYGPVGLFRAVVQLGQAHKQGTLDVDDNGNRIAKSTNKYSFDQKLFVDRIGRGLTGSALLALGFALSKCGLLTRKPDDEDERIMAQQAGVADYALKLGDVTVPINWAEPAGTTLLIGAAFEDVFDGDSSFLDGVRAFYLTGVNSFFDNSVLQNVTNLLGGNSTPGENVEDFVLGSATQFVPSLFKAIMNFFDPYERDTYDKNKFQRTLNKLMMYAPGLRQSLPVKVGTDGKIMESSYGDEPFERFVNSFIAPAIVKEKTNDRVNREIYRLYEAGYDGQVLPVANRTMTINSKKYTLTQTDQARLQKALGKACYDAIKDIMNSPEYKTLTNKEKAKLIHDTIYGENGKSGIQKDVLEEWNEIFSEYPRYNK